MGEPHVRASQIDCWENRNSPSRYGFCGRVIYFEGWCQRFPVNVESACRSHTQVARHA